MYKIELLILLCLLSAFVGMCLHIIYSRIFKRRKIELGMPIAKNIKIIIGKEITDLDMITAILNLSKMKFNIDKMQKIDNREKFLEIMKDTINEVYDDR